MNDEPRDDAPFACSARDAAERARTQDDGPVQPDDGFFFGIGAFETIAVEGGVPVFLERHRARLEEALGFFGLPFDKKAVSAAIGARLRDADPATRTALKVAVSERTIATSLRANPYTPADYERGFRVCTSRILRNESSPLVFRKTLCHADCILEKRAARSRGFDEAVFLNTQGLIAEGTASNVFFTQGASVYTPPVACGLLPGIMRAFVCETLPVVERPIAPGDIGAFDGMFLTNSLMGIMPVSSFDGMRFPSRAVADELMRGYRALVSSLRPRRS